MMDCLEDKLLAKILGFVPRQDQLTLFRVSKRWYKVMDECVGIDAFLGRGVSNERQDSLKMIMNFGVRSCLFDLFVNDSGSVPSLKHPDLLRFITFKNFVSTRTFQGILQGVTNLHTLKIDDGALYHLELLDINLILPCQVLDISSGRYFTTKHPYPYRYGGSRIMSRNITYLLQNSFPGLKSLIMDLESPPSRRDFFQNITEATVNFLKNHSDSLVCFDMTVYNESDDPISTEHVDIRNQEFPNLRKIRMKDMYMCGSNSSLESSMLNLASRLEDLEEIEFRCKYCATQVEAIIEKNAETLTTIKLGKGSLPVFDCKILQNCNRLKNLKIENCYYNEDEELPAGLINAQFLPKSLVQVHIKRVPVKNESCKIISLELPKLETLMLVEIVESCKLVKMGYGVRMDVAREILQRKQIKKLKIQAGGVGTEGDPYKDLLESAYECSMKYLACTLGENGEYVQDK